MQPDLKQLVNEALFQAHKRTEEETSKMKKCISKTHIRQTRGKQLKLRAALRPAPPFQGQHIRR